MLRAAGWALLSWLCYGVHAYLLARSLGVEGGAPLWLQCTGVREAALLLLGSTVTVPVAAVIAVSSRLLFIVGDLAWSAVAVLAARRVLRPPGPPPPP